MLADATKDNNTVYHVLTTDLETMRLSRKPRPVTGLDMVLHLIHLHLCCLEMVRAREKGLCSLARRQLVRVPGMSVARRGAVGTVGDTQVVSKRSRAARKTRSRAEDRAFRWATWTT